MRVTCECGCGRTFNRAETGRPRKYATDRCKERAKRRRRKAEDSAALAYVQDARVDDSESDRLCHICAQRQATRGGLICGECGDRGRDAA